MAKSRATGFLCLIILIASASLYALDIGIMWQRASIASEDGSIAMGAFVQASSWLSTNLGDNESALIPMPNVFYVTSPDLKDRLIPYSWLWSSAGVLLQANTTEAEILKVRAYFVDFVNTSSGLKYVVRDWNDPYDTLLYNANVTNGLMLLMHVVKVISIELNSGWSNNITIYERG